MTTGAHDRMVEPAQTVTASSRSSHRIDGDGLTDRDGSVPLTRGTWSGVLVPLLLVIWPAAATAQVPLYDPPPHVSLVDGDARLERNGRISSLAANLPVIPGDRLTAPRGRIEILLPDATLIHMDRRASLDLARSPDDWWLEAGTVVFTLPESVVIERAGPRILVSTMHGSVALSEPGRYALAVTGTDLELTVWRGSAELVGHHGAVAVRAGERAFVRSGARPSGPLPVDLIVRGELLRWVDTRSREHVALSSPYLPVPISVYAASLDRHGTWRHDPEHGSVWHPRVDAAWRPYSVGQWTDLGVYGTAWVGTTSWSWPTHHYGRWGTTSAGHWYWVPGTAWSPAWVSWAVAPGLVAWSPLRPTGRHDTDGARGVDLFQAHGAYDPSPGWSVVARGAIGFDVPIASAAVRPHMLDPDMRRLFVSQRLAPLRAGPAASGTVRIVGTRGVRTPTRQPRPRRDGPGRARGTTGTRATPTRSVTTPSATEVMNGASDRRGTGIAPRSRPVAPRAQTRPSEGTARPTSRTRSTSGLAAGPRPSRGPAARRAVPRRERPGPRLEGTVSPEARPTASRPVAAGTSSGRAGAATRPATRGISRPSAGAAQPVGGRSRVRTPAPGPGTTSPLPAGGRRATRRP